MMARLIPVPVAVFALTGLATSTASAQTNVGENHYGGIPWHVAAPGGASWSLTCRFRPVQMQMNQYERFYWANRLTRQGSGPMAGRLPEHNGRCTVTRTGGAGPVGLAMVKDGKVVADGSNDPARPAVVVVF